MNHLRLDDDRWLTQNTLPCIIPYLSVKEILEVSKVCTLWHSIIDEYYLRKYYVPMCYEHKDRVIEEHGSKIRRMRLMETNKSGLKTTMVSLRVRVMQDNINKQTTESKSGECQRYKEFLENVPDLTHFKFHTSWRLIYFNQSHGNSWSSSSFCWTSLLSLKHLKYLELRFHVPATFGLRVLRHLANLEVLKLHMYSGIDEHLFQAVRDLENIREMEIIKTSVTDDFLKFLPTLVTLEKLTLLIRAPCDTNYYLLMKTVVKLNSTLKHFRWVLNDVTMSDAFFGENCQRFLSLNVGNSLDKIAIERSLVKSFTNTEIKIEMETVFTANTNKDEKRCFECAFEREVNSSYTSTYDIGSF